MKMQKSLMLAMSAGCAVASASFAQVEPDVTLAPVGGEIVLGPTFTDRAITEVYKAMPNDCTTAVDIAGLGTGNSYVLEDVNFAPGPWGPAYTGARNITGIKWAWQAVGWTGLPLFPTTNTTQAALDFQFDFYAPGNFSSIPMLSPATPISHQVAAAVVGTNYAWYMQQNFATPIAIGTNTSVWISVRTCNPGTNTRVLDAGAGNVQPTGQTNVSNTYLYWGNTGPCIGSSVNGYGRDTDNNDVFNGGAAPLVGGAVNANDWRFNITTAAAPVPHNLSLTLLGDVVAGAPTPDFTFCNIADGTTNQALSVAASGKKWVKICTTNAVTDDLLRYLNIDTEGSADDLALALYDNGGALIAFDDNSGDGNNAQITMGLGRSAGVGAGSEYDGRDGQLTAAGEYYLAVAPGGSTFGGGFTVNASANATGAASFVHIATNVNAGGNLPAVAAPFPDHVDFTAGPTPSPWDFPGSDTLKGISASANPGPNVDSSDAVLWTKFAIDAPGADSGHYLDLDAGESDDADNVMYLFDSTGGLVAFSDDQTPGTNFNPAMSFGAATPGRNTAGGQTRGTVNDPAFAFAGQNGLLAPGTYYLAMIAFPGDVMGGQGGVAPTFGPDRRFHVRGLSGNNIGFTIQAFTGTGQACDSIDFNNDGLFPDTLDIDDFLSVFSGGPCSNDPNCGDIDYNNDGLFPDTLDIDALLSVFSGGACLQ